MDITITLTAEQEANGTIVGEMTGTGTLQSLCQRLIDAEAVNWSTIAASQAKTTRLAKLEAAPKELQDAVDAVELAVAVDDKAVVR